MAVKPSPDRSDLESKTREDLQIIARVKGVEVSARASKASLIEAIMSEPTNSNAVRSESTAPPATNASASRAIRSRRTVATPSDDFESLLGEFGEDVVAEVRPTAAVASGPSTIETPDSPAPTSVPGNSSNSSTNDRTGSPRQNSQPRPERPPASPLKSRGWRSGRGWLF